MTLTIDILDWCGLSAKVYIVNNYHKPKGDAVLFVHLQESFLKLYINEVFQL